MQNLKVGDALRQGDVVLRRLQDFAPTAQASSIVKSATLAYGEKTGHAHTLELDAPETGNIELFERNGILYLRTDAPSTLKHQEHGSIMVEPGSYQVHKQREQAEDNAYRQVID